MQTIIVGDGLTKDILSPNHLFQTSKLNVGHSEIDRLMGQGKASGYGPLPSFLRQAMEAQANGARVRTVLLKTVRSSDGDIGETNPPAQSHSSEFVEPLEDIAREAVVIPASPAVIPWTELLNVFDHAAGLELSSKPGKGELVRFLVVGCHTELRILAIASFLKNMLGCQEVAVSSHLVGSANQGAHFAALRHNLRSAGVRVFLDLTEATTYAGLDAAKFQHLTCRPCAINPPDVRDALSSTHRCIVEFLCMHWTRAELRPLAGGFSGSQLLFADGWKGEARTEPMVLKIDEFSRMRRELDGYHQVKDFFGKHVPTVGYPVIEGDFIGIGMELAAMQGQPWTLQDSFEAAEDEETFRRFMLRLDKALDLLSQKLYRNTRDCAWVVPYRAFGLHAGQQLEWLRQYVALILAYLGTEAGEDSNVDPEQLVKLLRLIASNDDGLDSEVCLSHGDLNFANIICDEGENLWFIDWTHTGQAPVELDFAKLENDVKFIMSKEFDTDDLPRLRRFEDYLLSQRLPADLNGLPDDLKFSKWDLRFRKILEAVRKIRQTCFELKNDDDWLVYRVALLRYALHTLGFDKRRGRGECDATQLMHALYSVHGLMFILVADDFHLKIRLERPSSYPPRQRVSIDEALWIIDSDEYKPPYHVDLSVLENDRTSKPGSWADPEDIARVKDQIHVRSAKYKVAEGRPLNPRGWTGIAGRGLLGRWGVNPSVAAVIVRKHREDYMEILLGGKENQLDLALPKGFVLPDETPDTAIFRVVEKKTGWQPKEVTGEVVFDGYTYDLRQTDHAWVERRGYLFQHEIGGVPDTFEPGGEFDEVKWWPLEAATVNRVSAVQARLIRESVTKLVETRRMKKSLAGKLLAST